MRYEFHPEALAEYETAALYYAEREYVRLNGKDRRCIEGQKYFLLWHWQNLNLDGRRALEQL